MKDLKIEVGKFYKTSIGEKVRIYAIDGSKDYPIHGAVLKSDGWEVQSWNHKGKAETYILNWFNIVSEWKDDEPFFDNWDVLPAWCDYAIAMDSTNKWFCFNKKPQLYLSSKWIVEITSEVDFLMIPKYYEPRNYNGHCKDSLLINPKYLQNDEK